MKPLEAKRPLIIPVFIPHAGCRQQCVFCNQHVITGRSTALPSADEMVAQIRSFLKFKKPFHEPVQISFYGGNFLGLAHATLDRLLNAALEFIHNRDVHGIRFSTSPSTVTAHKLEILQHYPIQTVELGVQSMEDRVLDLSRRGHTALDTLNAYNDLRSRGYEIGMQMMVGLPGDDPGTAMKTAMRMAALKPDFVRIYPTLVLKNSRLAEWYRQQKYTPLSLESAVSQVKEIYLYFQKKHIPVIRMGIQATDHLTEQDTILAGPYHPAFGHLVHSKIFLGKAISCLLAKTPPFHTAHFYVHPDSVPKLRGLKNANLKILKETFNLESVELKPDASLPPEGLRVEVDHRPH